VSQERPADWVRRIRWLGGSPCSGKSTALNTFSLRGLATYACDDRFDEHADAGVSDGRPTFAKVTAMPTCARLAQPVDVQVSDVFALAAEQWPYIVSDLEAVDLEPQPSKRPLVAEGSALLPRHLRELGVNPTDAVWLVATPGFQRQQYANRAWARDLVSDCADPTAAFDRWMRRDAQFAIEIADEARRWGARVVEVDGSLPAEDTAEVVGRHLGLQ
jgi:hypothetical protein